MHKLFILFIWTITLRSPRTFAAGLDDLSRQPEATIPAKPTTAEPAKTQTKPEVSSPAAPKPTVTPPTQTIKAPPLPKAKKPADGKPSIEEKPKEQGPENAASSKSESETTDKKPMVKSAASKRLEDRLSIGPSLGWSIVKPTKGSWIGLGSADVLLRWKTSPAESSRLFFTTRYAPVAGVWSYENRDYDTTLHGIYAGAEYMFPVTSNGSLQLKASAEAGYMLVYAKSQDGNEEHNDVKKGTMNLTLGGGADWSFRGDKVKVGPFTRIHTVGFTVINFGVATQFVF